MKRREAREQALALVFSKQFNEDVTAQEISELSKISMDMQDDDFCDKLFNGVCDNVEEIDSIIDKYIIGWNRTRISRVALSVLRLAIYEIMYIPEIPDGVAVNEAVELSKKFATDDDASFVNGILGSIIRDKNK